MCGVAAIVSPREGDGSLVGRLDAMVGALRARGPDHSGTWQRGPVALGHTRLRVVDPEPRADQPMSFAQSHLVFSGAILGYASLRRELETDYGVVFRTRGDTEVLLHALRVHGAHVLPRLEGMFAFAYHDEARGSLLLARDRAGIKPLVFAADSRGRHFAASEVGALFAGADLPRRVDPIALRQVLRHNHTLGERTYFEGISRLLPGHAREIDVRTGATRTFQFGKLALAPRPTSARAAEERLDAAFVRSVARARDVDVDVGVYLSGGVDSAGIAAASSLAHDRFFGLVVGEGALSEERDIVETAQSLGAQVELVRLGEIDLAGLIEYAGRAEMPQFWTSDLALSVLAAKARERGVKVVLAGEGPDELFAGYDVYRVSPFRPAFTGPLAPLARLSSIAAHVGQRFVPWLPLDSSVVEAYLRSHHAERRRHVVDHFGFYPENLALWEAVEQRAPLLASSDDASAREVERVHSHASLASTAHGLSSLERNLQWEISERLPSWILHMGDRMSSAHGIELRFPYLDDAFVAEALTMPERLRATPLENKRVLRRIHERRLPKAITRRRKKALYTDSRAFLPNLLSEPGVSTYWSREAFARVGLLDFGVCDAARARIAASTREHALGGMVDEWLFTFALTAQIIAVEVCGA